MARKTAPLAPRRATGPELCAELAFTDPHDIADERLLGLLADHARQLAYQQAQLWSVMAELATRDPAPNLPRPTAWSRDEVFDSAAEEIRAELMLTRRGASDELATACAVAELPRVMQALADGWIDRRRASVLAGGCLDLTPEQTSVLLDYLLPEAATMTATDLHARLRKIAIALDPGWAERRYREAVRDRKIVSYLNRDGSATITGQNLPADSAAYACTRVDALAREAKRAGAHARIDHLRADIYLGLLDGTLHGSHVEIIAELVRSNPKPASTAPTGGEDQQAADAAASEPTHAAASEPTVARADRVQPHGVHLQVRLSTLLGLDDLPADVGGWGSLPASLARSIAAKQHRCEWRFAIVDEHGRMLSEGITRRRPRLAGNDASPPGARLPGGVVELHVPLTLLTDLDLPGDYPDWARLLADLLRQHREHRPIEQEPSARFACRPLRRRVQTFFKTCIFPGCRRPAGECDLDHEHEHARGGRTEEANLDAGCRHDHGLKSSRGWRLIRRDESTYLWISPLGRRHEVSVDPIAAALPVTTPRPLPIGDNYAEDDDRGCPNDPLAGADVSTARSTRPAAARTRRRRGTDPHDRRPLFRPAALLTSRKVPCPAHREPRAGVPPRAERHCCARRQSATIQP